MPELFEKSKGSDKKKFVSATGTMILNPVLEKKSHVFRSRASLRPEGGKPSRSWILGGRRIFHSDPGYHRSLDVPSI